MIQYMSHWKQAVWHQDLTFWIKQIAIATCVLAYLCIVMTAFSALHSLDRLCCWVDQPKKETASATGGVKKCSIHKKGNEQGRETSRLFSCTAACNENVLKPLYRQGGSGSDGLRTHFKVYVKRTRKLIAGPLRQPKLLLMKRTGSCDPVGVGGQRSRVSEVVCKQLRRLDQQLPFHEGVHLSAFLSQMAVVSSSTNLSKTSASEEGI